MEFTRLSAWGLSEDLMHDEEKHIDFLETQLSLINDPGVQLHVQHHIGDPKAPED